MSVRHCKTVPKINFQKKAKSLIDVLVNAKEIDFLSQVFDDKMLEKICIKTNRYARKECIKVKKGMLEKVCTAR